MDIQINDLIINTGVYWKKKIFILTENKLTQTQCLNRAGLQQ